MEVSLSMFLQRRHDLFAYIKSLLNITFGLNYISLATYLADSIFYNIILCCLAFCRYEIKLALLIL